MIEGYNNDGLKVLINPRAVASVYAGGEAGYGFWCNVQMEDGTVHRFRGPAAEKVYAACRIADVS